MGAKTARCARPKYCACVVCAHMPYCTPRSSGCIVRTTKNTYPRYVPEDFPSEISVFTGIDIDKADSRLANQSQRNDIDMLGSPPAEAFFEVALLSASTSAHRNPITRDYIYTCTYRFSTGNLCRACAEPLCPTDRPDGI